MPKYDKSAQGDVKKAMHEHKHAGKFKNKEQAIAVGLSKARSKGKKIPEKD